MPFRLVARQYKLQDVPTNCHHPCGQGLILLMDGLENHDNRPEDDRYLLGPWLVESYWSREGGLKCMRWQAGSSANEVLIRIKVVQGASRKQYSRITRAQQMTGQ